jgi:hypothetical protein
MNDREAFEKWVCDLNRAPTAWEAWQAALQHPQPAVPDEKLLPELMMASYHEAKGWNDCRNEMLRLLSAGKEK